MKSFTETELDLLIATAAKHSERDAMLIQTVYNHGLRASEAIELGPGNLISGKLQVKRLKGSRTTTQSILPGERDFLEANLPTGRPFKMHRTTFWRKMQRYCVEAGLDKTKAHPHTLKHTTGRLAYKAGVGVAEIQSILGHVNGSNAMIYMQADEDEAFSAFAAKAGR
jgi:integrase